MSVDDALADEADSLVGQANQGLLWVLRMGL